MVTRRKFLGTTLGAAAALAAGSCATQPPGRRLIVDSQLHVWKANSPDYPWRSDANPQLPEPFTIERALPLMDEAGIDRVVLVPPVSINDLNTYCIEAALRYPERFKVMGRVDLEDPKSAALLSHWKKQPGMLGVRLPFNGNRPVWLDDGTADWFWPAAEKAGLPVMFLAYGLAPKFAPIAQRHPGLPLIVDHMAVNSQMAKNGTLVQAIRDVAALARFPNVSVKLSAIGNSSLEPYPYRDMTDSIHRLFDAFGPRRCYWGSDLTLSYRRGTYRQRVTHFTEELKFLSESDKDWVMGRAILERLNWPQNT